MTSGGFAGDPPDLVGVGVARWRVWAWAAAASTEGQSEFRPGGGLPSSAN